MVTGFTVREKVIEDKKKISLGERGEKTMHVHGMREKEEAK